MPYSLDDQHDPLISMHIHGWLTDADFERVVTDLERLDERGRPYVVVLDCSGLRVPESGQIRRLRSRFASSPTRHQRGLACVATTPMLRGTIRALLQTRALRVPFTLVADPEAGRRWATEQLEVPQSIAS